MTAVSGRILLVDDDPAMLRLLTLRLRSLGCTVQAEASGPAALTALDRFDAHLVITDLRMDELDGVALMELVQRRRPGLPVLMITAHGTIPQAVEATQRGAFAFLTKPIDKTELEQQVARALEISVPVDESTPVDEEIITRNPRMRELLSQTGRVAASSSNVLITGESGTGKELIARRVHRSSSRSQSEFVDLNCAAIPAELLESELFGHEKGAFTGAGASRRGLFRVAHGGTLFLDEIGDMPAPLQSKLLRTLEDGKVRPLGASRSVDVDVRVVSATHQDLSALMSEGAFRQDLYYRLNVVELEIPPLRQRREDIPLLAEHFLKMIAGQTRQAPKRYAPDAMALLVRHDWPGNVRQLCNVVERNVVLVPACVINAPAVESALGEHASELLSLREARAAFMRQYLVELLAVTEGNVSRAAQIAKRNRTDLYRLMAQLEVDPARFKVE